MRARSRFAILVVIILAAFTIAVQVGAETMKWRVVLFNTKVEVLQIGDVPDHIIALYDQTGLASFDTGEVASVASKGTLDYIKASGTHGLYIIFTFEDGSTITAKGQGTTRTEPGAKSSRFEATWTCIQGTGRWAGIQGGGTYTGRRFAPVIAGSTQLYLDFTATYTLPPK